MLGDNFTFINQYNESSEDNYDNNGDNTKGRRLQELPENTNIFL